MRNRKFFFLNIILLTLIFVTLSFPASAFSSGVSYTGDNRIFVHRDTTIKDSFQPDVFVVFFIVAVALLFPLLLFLSLSFLSRVFGEPINRTKKPPAYFLARFAEFLPEKHRESLLQEISDMRLEYYEALSKKEIWQARCIIAFYYIGLSWSVIMWISDKVKEVVGIIPKKN